MNAKKYIIPQTYKGFTVFPPEEKDPAPHFFARIRHEIGCHVWDRADDKEIEMSIDATIRKFQAKIDKPWNAIANATDELIGIANDCWTYNLSEIRIRTLRLFEFLKSVLENREDVITFKEEK
jgi:hypothetical protein